MLLTNWGPISHLPTLFVGRSEITSEERMRVVIGQTEGLFLVDAAVTGNQDIL